MQEDSNHFMKIMAPIADLLEKKGKSYGPSFNKSGNILHILYPNGVQPDEYKTLLTVTRIIDKLFRIATNKRDPMGESPWKDIVGYAVLALASDEDEKSPAS